MFFKPTSSFSLVAWAVWLGSIQVTPAGWPHELSWLSPFSIGQSFWLCDIQLFPLLRSIWGSSDTLGVAGESGLLCVSFLSFVALAGRFARSRLFSTARALPGWREEVGESPESCNLPVCWTCWSFSIVFKCCAKRMDMSSRVRFLPLLAKRLASIFSEDSII